MNTTKRDKIYNVAILGVGLFAVRPYLKTDLPSISLYFCLALFLVTLITNLGPLRWLSAICLNGLYFGLFYYGHYFHSAHPWLIGSIFFCLLKATKKENKIRKIRLYETLAVVLLSHYLFSALHKILPFLFNPSPFNYYLHFLDNFAFQYLNAGHTIIGPTPYLLENAPWVIALGSGLTLLFQLSSLWAIFKPHFRKTFVFMSFVFHGLSYVFLGINMILSPLGLAFFVLCLGPRLKTKKISHQGSGLNKDY